jgi:hypothetical protein
MDDFWGDIRYPSPANLEGSILPDGELSLTSKKNEHFLVVTGTMLSAIVPRQ